jgi:UDP-GlcNAc3NAcA epimerase
LVYGDTNSTLAGALAASKLHIPIAHVEAGLRSFNMKMPEEVNRILTDRISNFLFCPTQVAKDNLLSEGYKNIDCNLDIVGDVMLDAALYYASRINQNDFENKTKGDFILCTVHRAENTDDPKKLAIIIDALNEIHKKNKVILPLHPRTKQKIKEFGLEPKFEIIDPVGYLEMISYLQNCQLVITDSGGLQKEAYFFEKKCVTLRDQTEWVELISEGVNVLSPIELNSIKDKVYQMLEKEVSFDSKLYGEGNAANKIVEILKTYYS